MSTPRHITLINAGHRADSTGLNRFTKAMRAKLDRKRMQGRGGWNKPLECSMSTLRTLLEKHLEKGDMIDIANLAMMIWNREHPNGSAR